MDFPKKQAQRLMPLYLLEYSEKLFTNHPNPEDPWGGGSDYTAGQGITITNNEISVDTNVIATKSDLPTKVSELENDSNFISSSLGNTKPYSKYEGSPLGGSWKRVTYDTSGILIETNDSTHLLGFPINKEGEIVVSTDIPDFTKYYYINNEIQNGEFITKINGDGLEYSKQWTPNSISITANCTEMGFENKPAIVVKTDLNKKVVVSDSIAVYNNEHNSVAGIDGDNVTVSSIDGRYTRLENGKLTYESDGQVREFNLPSNKGQGIYTLATTDDIPSLTGYATETWVQNQGYATSSEIPTNYVTTDTAQTISGEKTFNDDIIIHDDTPYHTKWNSSNLKIEAERFILSGEITEPGLGTVKVTENIILPFSNQSPNRTVTLATTSDIPSLDGYATQTWVQEQGYATSSSLATVATTGSYNDLTDKPNLLQIINMTEAFTFTETGTHVPPYKWGENMACTSTWVCYGSVEALPQIYLQHWFGIDECYAYPQYIWQDPSGYHAVYSTELVQDNTGASGGRIVLNAPSLGVTWTSVSTYPTYSKTYTAGTGIDIINNTISVDDTVALKSEVPSTATSTSTSTVTSETGTFVTGTSTNTTNVVNSVTYTPSSETLTFTYADNTTASFTFLTSSTTVTSGTTSVVTSVTDSTSNAMTGATVSTSTTTTLS